MDSLSMALNSVSLHHENSQYSFSKPRNQSFSLPVDIILYLLNNCDDSPKIILKLQKTCKYFFAKTKNKAIIMDTHVFYRECYGRNLFYYNPNIRNEDNNLVLFDDKIEKITDEKSNKYWLAHSFVANSSSPPVYISLIYRCNLQSLSVDKQTLSYDELKFLFNGGNVTSLRFDVVKLNYADGSPVTVDAVMELCPNIRIFQYSNILDTFSVSNMEKMNLVKFNNKLEGFSFGIVQIEEGEYETARELLCDFIRKNIIPRRDPPCCHINLYESLYHYREELEEFLVENLEAWQPHANTRESGRYGRFSSFFGEDNLPTDDRLAWLLYYRGEPRPHKNSKYSFNSPRQQNFSLPMDAILYILNNCNSFNVLRNLPQTCKYFLAKKRVIVVNEPVYYLDHNGRSLLFYKENKWEEPKNFLLEDGTMKYWIFNSLVMFDISRRPPYSSMFYQCNLQSLKISQQTLLFEEFNFLLNGKNIEKLRLEVVKINYSDGSPVTIDTILEQCPNIMSLAYVNVSDNFTVATMERLNALKFVNKLCKFHYGIFELQTKTFKQARELLSKFIQKNVVLNNNQPYVRIMLFEGYGDRLDEFQTFFQHRLNSVRVNVFRGVSAPHGR